MDYDITYLLIKTRTFTVLKFYIKPLIPPNYPWRIGVIGRSDKRAV